MRVNLTKKDLINQIYMQLGFSKLVSENLINDFFSTIILNLKEEKILKLSGFGTFSIRRLSKTKKPVIWGWEWIMGNLPPIGKILKFTENINWAKIAPQKGGIAYEDIPIILTI